MPYIKRWRRELLPKRFFSNLFGDPVAGDMNYLFSTICKEYMDGFGESYQSYQDCIGALECAKLELYVRHVRPYEDHAIATNGDI